MSVGDAASNARRQAPAWIRKRPPDTPPVDVFCCRGRSPGSQVVITPGLPNAAGASVTQKSGATRCLQLRGQRRNLAKTRDSPASLLATKSCDQADRDVYMSCYSGLGVNGNQARNQKNLAPPDKAVKNIRCRIPRFDRVDARTGLPVSGPRRGSSGSFPEAKREAGVKPELPPQL